MNEGHYIQYKVLERYLNSRRNIYQIMQYNKPCLKKIFNTYLTIL